MNQLTQLSKHQRYDLLFALAETAKVKASHFDSHTVTDSLIDLEDFSLISYDEKLYQVAESLDNLTQAEILNLIISIAKDLNQPEVKAA